MLDNDFERLQRSLKLDSLLAFYELLLMNSKKCMYTAQYMHENHLYLCFASRVQKKESND